MFFSHFMKLYNQDITSNFKIYLQKVIFRDINMIGIIKKKNMSNDQKFNI